MHVAPTSRKMASPAKKLRVETTKLKPLWQVSGPGLFYNLDTETCEALEKAWTSKTPNGNVSIMNVPHGFDLAKMELWLADKPPPTNPVTSIRRLQRGLWEYPDDQGLYVALYDDDNDLIEAAWRLQTCSAAPLPFQTKDVSWNKGYNTLYTYTFSPATVFPPTAEQKNEDSGRIRKFRRSDPDQTQVVWDTKNFGIQNMQLPTVISTDASPADTPGTTVAPPTAAGTEAASTPAASDPSAPSKITVVTSQMLQVPDTWEPQTSPFQRFPVQKGSPEYHSIIDPFLKKLHQKTDIVSLERIQNSMLWKFYALTRWKIALRNNGNPNEKYLYHGARVRENMDAIMNFGFDMRVAQSGSAGIGVYFAVHSSYSNGGYVLCDPKTKTKEMFVCRVTIGSCTQGKHGLVRPPPKSNKKSESGDLYDSVHNSEDVMYIIFDNMQAYPEYLIKYKA